MDYKTAHRQVRDARGKASEHPCYKCGKPAKDWAYQYPETSSPPPTDPKGRPYSGDVMDYAPMCFGCHVTFDRSKEQRLRDIVADNARRSSAALAERRKTDRGLDERMRAASIRNLALGRSPEQALAAGLAGGAAMARRRREDPELDAKMRAISVHNGAATAKTLNAHRVRCADCGRESTPGPMARHFRASGHRKD